MLTLSSFYFSTVFIERSYLLLFLFAVGLAVRPLINFYGEPKLLRGAKFVYDT